MKKIIIRLGIIILSFLFISITYASTLLDINVDKRELNKDETVNLTISVTTDSRWKITVRDIIWLDNFIQMWQTSSTSMSIINWQTKNNHKVVLKLKPLKSWDFFIWPVNMLVWTNLYTTKNIKIKVNGIDNNNIPKVEKNNINKKIENNNQTKENTSPPPNLPLAGEEKTSEKKDDIRDIKTKVFFWEKMVFFPILFFIFIYIFYVVLNKYMSYKDEKVVKTEKNPLIVYSERKNKLFKELSDIDLNIAKSEFYSNLNMIFREYFDLLWVKEVENMTLKEIKKQIELDDRLVELFEQSYINEFALLSDREEDLKERKELIYNLINHIKQKW